MTSGLMDYEAQDQETRALISSALDQTLFVEAGAGTGKTRALVDRVIALVLSGKKIERQAAITFTEKAAAELRDRIRQGLETAREGGLNSEQVIDTALTSLARAQISTIHSFCQQILRFHAAEAGIDPSFRVEDEVQSARRFQDSWRMYLEDISTDNDAAYAIERVLGLGLTPADIETLARELTRQGDLAWQLEKTPLEAPAPLWPDVTQMSAELSALQLEVADADDPLRMRVERLRSLVANIVRAGGEREPVLAAGAGILELRWGVSSKDAWGGGSLCQQVRDAAEGVCDSLRDLLERCRSEALAGLMPIIVRFVVTDAVQRGREGLLTFDDLIVRSRDLLRDNPDAVRSLHERCEVMLIDEFQDTDPMQVDIARSFADKAQAGAVQPGSLFLVGDPKQSIYRFRRADMAIYSRTQTDLASQGAVLPNLALNRRSRPAILDWVNQVFGEMIGDGRETAIQPPYRPIHPDRDDVLRGPGVAWIGGELAGVNARDCRRLECAELARQCLTARSQGWEVVDPRGRRAVRFADVAILIPARTILAPLERALASAGIPYRVEGGSLIYRTQEVRDLINCLTAIDDPSDEVAIVGALRSPAFACSDVEIARHKAEGGRFDYLSSTLDGRNGPVADSLRVLARYHRERHERSLAALVERFAAERGLVEVGILDQGSRNSFRRVRFVVEQARLFESNVPESLRAFVVWMERRFSEAILDNEGSAVDDDEDSVRVMTVHGAKGLEFPIVFVAGLSWYPSSRTAVYTVDRTSGETYVCVGAKGDNRRFVLGNGDHISALEKRHADAEHARLLYVAATRARDHLIVSLYRTNRSRDTCGAVRLIAAGASDVAPELPSPADVRPDAAAAPFSGLALDAPASASAEAFAVGREVLLQAARGKRYESATAIMGDLGTRIAVGDKEGRDEEGEPWAHGRGGSRLGRAVHAAIQSLPLDADDGQIAAFSRAQAVAEAIPHREADVKRLVQWALRSSQAAARALAAPRAFREVPFAVEENGVVLEGFVDLLIQTDDGIEIVDWKTDQIRADGISARLEKYRLQAGLYVIGIETATGQRVKNITYVFADPGIEESPGDPAALAAAARLELAGRAGAG